MRVNYCDICDCPIKDEIYYFWNMSVSEFEKGITSSFSKKKGKNITEICVNCKKLIDDILNVRKKGLANLKKELEHSFNL